MPKISDKYLTDGEVVYLSRKRSGKTQLEFSRELTLGVQREVITLLEKGLLFLPKEKVEELRTQLEQEPLSDSEKATLLRRRLGMSQTEAAHLMSTHQTTICDYEKGRLNPEKYIQALEGVLNARA